MCEASLASAGGRLFGLVPRLGDLTARGPLLLRVASALGRRWQSNPQAAKRFVREAVRLGRLDAVAAFLRASERQAPGFFHSLIEADAGLLRKISHTAHRHGAARRYLRPYLGALHQVRTGHRARRRI